MLVLYHYFITFRFPTNINLLLARTHKHTDNELKLILSLFPILCLTVVAVCLMKIHVGGHRLVGGDMGDEKQRVDFFQSIPLRFLYFQPRAPAAPLLHCMQ